MAEPLSVTSFWDSIFISFITLSNTRPNVINNIEPPCLKLDYTAKGFDFKTPTLIITVVYHDTS